MIDTSIPVEQMTYEGDSFEFVKSPAEIFSVEFRDIDGSIISSQEVLEGTPATIPTQTPNYDSEYLEFEKWRADGNLTSVNGNIIALPQYKVKTDQTLGLAPTYLICYFDSTQLSPIFYFSNYGSYGYNFDAYIDYGDGSTPEQITAKEMAHTYTTAGEYIVKIWGNAYWLGGQSSVGIFKSTDYKNCLHKAYLGTNAKLGSYSFSQNVSLKMVVLDSDITNWQGLTYLFYNCKMLKAIILPEQMTSIAGQQIFYGDEIYLITPNVLCAVAGNTLQQAVILNSERLWDKLSFTYYSGYAELYIPNASKKLVLPSTVSHFSIGTQLDASALEEVDFTNSNYSSLTISGTMRLKKLKLKAGNNSKLNWGSSTNLTIDSLTIPADMTFSMGYNCSLKCRKFKYLNPTPSTSSYNKFQYLKDIELASNVYGITSGTFGLDSTNFTTLILASDWNTDLRLPACITTDSLLGVCRSLKDLTGETSLTFTMSANAYKTRMETIYVDSTGYEAQPNDSGAMTLLEYVQAKNWTVSFG